MSTSASKRGAPARSPSGTTAGRAKPVVTRHPIRTSKVSITVDADVLREVKKLIRGTGASLSAHVTQALESDLRRRRMQQLIDAYEAGNGTITEEELSRAGVTGARARTSRGGGGSLLCRAPAQAKARGSRRGTSATGVTAGARR